MDIAEPPPKARKRGVRELREQSPDLEHEFEAIYKREYPIALRYARRWVDDDTADDVVQNVFVKFWEGYAASPALVFRRDVPEYVRATIIEAVRNKLRDHHDAEKAFQDNAAAIREHTIRHFRGRTPSDLGLSERELSALLDELLAKMPPRQREVFMLVKCDGMSYEITAAILGLSTATVHQHLVKANKFLRRELKPYRLPEPAWWFKIDETLNNEADDDDRFPIDASSLRRHRSRKRAARRRRS